MSASHPQDDHLPPSPYARADDYYQHFNSYGPSLASADSRYPTSAASPPSPSLYDTHTAAAGAMLFDDSPFTLPGGALLSAGEPAPSLFTSLHDDDGSASFSSSSPTADFPSFSSFPDPPAAQHSASTSAAWAVGSSSTPIAPIKPTVPHDSSHTAARSVPPPTPASDSAHSSPSTTRPPPKKRRVRGLPPEQRIERRRAQHRAVDAARRQKENEAIDRLQRLLVQRQRRQQQQQEGTGVEGQAADDEAVQVEGDEDAEGSGSGSDSSKKRGRLTVLESSIALIERLTDVCQRMEDACNAKDVQLRRVSSHLHSVAASIAHRATTAASTFDDDTAADPDSQYRYSSRSPAASPPSYSSLTAITLPNGPSSPILSILPPSTSSYLAHSDRSHTLLRSGLAFSSSMCVTVVNVTNGVILDINDRFLSCTGWRRSDLLHTSMDKADVAGGYPLSPILLRKRSDKYGRDPIEYLPQYPGTMVEIDAVIRGVKRKGDSRWRCRMGDGTIFECHTTMWSEYDDREAVGEQYGMVQQPNGTVCLGVLRDHDNRHRSPDRIVIVFAIEDAVIIEKLEDWRIGDN